MSQWKRKQDVNVGEQESGAGRVRWSSVRVGRVKKGSGGRECGVDICYAGVEWGGVGSSGI